MRQCGDFAALDEPQREQVLALSRSARDTIAAARFTTSIRDRLQRYLNQEYPAQLALASRRAAPVPVPANDGEPTPAPAPAIRYRSASSLKVDCGLPYISNDAELEQWLGALRAAARAELERGNRISL